MRRLFRLARNFPMAWLALAVVGCAERPGATRRSSEIDTLPSGVIRVRNSVPDVSPPDWTILETLRIGAADGEGPDVFGQIRDFLVDEDKRIFVLDYMSQDVRVFDSLGTHLFSFGGKGAGPGELEWANGLAWHVGEIWVNDVGNSRFSVFRSDGTFLTSHRRPVTVTGVQWLGGVDLEGRVYYETVHGLRPYDPTPGVQVSSMQLLLVQEDAQTGVLDSFPWPRYNPPFYRLPGGAAAIPFAAGDVKRFDPRGYIWNAVSDRYRICQTALAGDTLLVIERSYNPIPVTPEERAREIQGIEDFMDRAGAADLDYSVIPEYKPALDAMDLDDRYRLWVRPVGPGDGTDFDVYDVTGLLIATARAPFRIEPHRKVAVVGSSLFTVLSDSLGVEYVVVGEIVVNRVGV